jgi:hypothetical protein
MGVRIPSWDLLTGPGLPATDELAAPGGPGVFPGDAHGRVSYFRRGLIYRSPSTGAVVVGSHTL